MKKFINWWARFSTYVSVMVLLAGVMQALTKYLDGRVTPTSWVVIVVIASILAIRISNIIERQDPLT